jgi:hypothetical protein
MSTWESFAIVAGRAHAPEFFFEEADQPLDQIREVVRVRRLPHLLAPGGGGKRPALRATGKER